MSTGYLLLVHDQPSQVRRLIAALQGPGVSFVVHVDAKADRASFVAALRGLSGVHVLPPSASVAVNWGGYSQTQAMLNLCAAGLEQCSDARRFTLLSGACYPVASNARLQALASSPDLLIDLKLTPPELPRYERVRHYHLSDHPLTNRRGSTDRSPRERSYIRYIKDFVSSLPPRPPFPVPLYYGPTWWSLTRPALEYVMRYCQEHPELLTEFRYSAHADEHLVHTILGNSHWAEASIGSGHYFAWEEFPKRHCRTLDISDLDRIPPTALFVRKVDPAGSAELLERLDQARAPTEAPR